MNTFLAILLIGAMLATLATLILGIVSFLKTAGEEARSDAGPSDASLRSNRLMMRRIQFQGLAIFIIALIFFFGATKH